MMIGDVLKDYLQLLGYANSSSAPQMALDRALIDINAAIQEMADGGEDFFNREEISMQLVADVPTYTLPKTVQTVLKPVRVDDDDRPLRELMSRSQLAQFEQVFMGEVLGAPLSGKPTAYFVESLKDASDTTGDSVKIVVHLRPKPLLTLFSAGTAQLIVPVINQPGQMTADQLTAGIAVLEIPHKYVESIFLPLMRYNATKSFLFYQKEKLPGIEADYGRALALLGKADPRSDAGRAETNVGGVRTPPPQTGNQKAAA